MPDRRGPTDGTPEPPELRRLRRRIDALDRRIVGLMNERARLGLAVGVAKTTAGRRAVLDAEREREVLLRVAMANHGPLSQAELIAVYRRLILATRRLELVERRRSAVKPVPSAAPPDAPGQRPPTDGNRPTGRTPARRPRTPGR
jgi:chorismate mutase